ncbi:MAG: DUF1080 domain-containing protein [Pirellulaceae bacterium]
MITGAIAWSLSFSIVGLGAVVHVAQSAESDPELTVNTVAAGGSNDGPRLPLFDGTSLVGWKTTAQQPPPDGWVIEEGALHRKSRSGHLVYFDREFSDFELHWEWKIAPGGNSGVKYRLADYGGRLLGLEYQLLDDLRHSNAKDPERSAGALYGLYAPSSNKHLKPVGEFNESRVIVRDGKIEHWPNGEQILAVDTRTEEFRQRVAASKFNEYPGFAERQKGWIMLQDHGNEVWFRNVWIREFSSKPAEEAPGPPAKNHSDNPFPTGGSPSRPDNAH